MAEVRAVWRTADRRYRIELVRDRGRDVIRVIDRTMHVATLPNEQKLEEWLREHAGIGFADLVED